MNMRALMLATAGLLFSCSNPEASSLLRSSSASIPLWRASLDSPADFADFSKVGSGIIQNGRAEKFLIDMRTASPSIYFINANYTEGGVTPDKAKYHYDFAQAPKNIGQPELGGIGIDDREWPLERFNAETYFTDTKSAFVAGTLNTYFIAGNPEPLYGVQFYAQDTIKEMEIVAAVRIIKAKITIKDARVAFVSSGNQQTIESAEAKMAMASLNVAVMTIEQILGSVTYIAMHRGEAWGYLRIFPAQPDELRPTDIAVFKDLPLDLSVVAATMTKAYQDSNSHVNLKSKERDTPNMVLRDASPNHPDLVQWADRPVHLIVMADGFKIEASTAEVVAEKYHEKLRSRNWTSLQWDRNWATLQSYSDMCQGRAQDCLAGSKKYGSKAANLGYLTEVLHDAEAQRYLGVDYKLVPVGFGVPLKFYDDFVNLSANRALKEELERLQQMILSEDPLDSAAVSLRVAQAERVRELFLNGVVPPEELRSITTKVTEFGGGNAKWKIRSSANAEDIPNFDGAGLHDSYTAKPEAEDRSDNKCRLELDSDVGPGEVTKMKIKPKTIACAIKGVYASLWNRRAIEERSFARIDPRSVSMGLSVLPAYANESPVIANSVVVTRVVNSPDILGYTLSVQKDNNTVTNPAPGTYSETTIAALPSANDEPLSFTVVRYAKPLADAPALSEAVLKSRPGNMELMVNIARYVEESYCRDARGYYNGDCSFVAVDSEKPKSLDFEMKILDDGRFVVKQVREFNGH